MVDSAAGEEIAAAIEERLVRGDTTWEPALKRVPAPYDKDHPRGDLLRRKSMVLFHDMPLPEGDLAGAIEAEFRQLWPVFAPIQRGMAGI